MTVSAQPSASESSALSWQPAMPLPSAHGYAAAYAGILNGSPAVVGGTNFPNNPFWEQGKKVWSRELYHYDRAYGKWTQQDLLPVGHAHGSSFSYEGGLYLVGGQTPEAVSATVYRVSRKDGAYQLDVVLPPLPEPLFMTAGILLGDYFYLVGGRNDSSPAGTHSFYRIEPGAADPQWESLPAWPGAARFLSVVAESKGELILISGMTSGEEGPEYLTDAFAYNSESGWRPLAALPHAAAAAATPAPVSADGRVLVIGGVDGKQIGLDPATYPKVPRRIQAYDPSTGEWSLLNDAPMARVCVTTLFWENRFWLPTGESSPGTRSPEVWTLSR